MSQEKQSVEVQDPIDEVEVPELFMINDLNQFMAIFIKWHTAQVDTLKHIMELPEDSEIVIGDDSTSLQLSGDVRKAFQLGINLSLGYLADLPFVPEYEDEVVAH